MRRENLPSFSTLLFPKLATAAQRARFLVAPRASFVILPLVLATGLVPAFAASAPHAALELAPPDSKVLLGIDIKSLRSSFLGQTMSAQIRSQMGSGQLAMFMPLVEQTFNNVDYVFVASSGTGDSSAKPGAGGFKSRPADTDGKPPVLMVLEGNFAATPLSFFMTGTPERYRATDIYQTAQPVGVKLALLNDRLLVMGDDKSIRTAIDRIGEGIAIQPALLAHASELAEHHDFWISAPDSFSSMRSNSSDSSRSSSSFATSQIEGLEMGITYRDGFEMEVNVSAQTEDAARQMSQLAFSDLQSAIGGQMDNEVAAAIASKLKISSQGKTLHMSLTLTQAELEKQIRASQAARMLAERRAKEEEKRARAMAPRGSRASLAASSTTPGTRGSATVAMDGPRKVRIIGLDDGPREIDWQSSK